MFPGGLEASEIKRLLEQEAYREYAPEEIFSMLVYMHKRIEYIYQLLDKGDLDPKDFKQGAMYQNFIESFNKLTKSKYRGDSKTESLFKARIKDGYAFKDILKAIYAAEKDDFLMGRDGGKKYLTPAYILRPEKLAEYLSLFEEKYED